MERAVVSLVVLATLATCVLDCEVTKTNANHRTRRQSPVPVMNPPIPSSIAHYLGANQVLDKCERDEVLVSGACHRVLTRGPCQLEEQVLLDPATLQGFCAPRLCPPDRIFVFSDQLCHDPRNYELCPPGRQLYQSAYGTPICQCPDGTYEGDDDLDDDVCDPLLGQTLSCPPGQVLWFRDFSMPPECLPDPCGGDNLNRGPNDLPFVPSATDGRCYQLGRSTGVCPAKTWYSLALEMLKGMCTSLEEAGYQIFDEETMNYFNQVYGPPIPRETTTPLATPASPQTPSTQGQARFDMPRDPKFSGQPVSGQNVLGQTGMITPGQNVIGQSGVSPGHNIMRRPGVSTSGQNVAGQAGISTGHNALGQPSLTGHSTLRNSGQLGGFTTVQRFSGQSGGSTPALPGSRTPGSRTPGSRTPGSRTPDFRTPGSKTPGVSTSIRPGVSTGGVSTGGVSKGGVPGVFTTVQTFMGQSRPTTPGQRRPGQAGAVTPAQPGGFTSVQTFSGYPAMSTPAQAPRSQTQGSGHRGVERSRGRGGAERGRGATVTPLVPQASHVLSPRLPQGGTPSQTSPVFPPPLPHMAPHSSAMVTQFGTSPFFSYEQQSLEVFDGDQSYYMMDPSFGMARSISDHPQAQNQARQRTHAHQRTRARQRTQTQQVPQGRGSGHASAKRRSTLSVRKGELLTKVMGLMDSPNTRHDLNYLQTPTTHELHHFYNGVWDLMSDVLAGRSHQEGYQHHHRVRRSPLPHATPGNVFETRLVACRAGAQRDINAKCRDTILPARVPVKRSTRVVPPVPPRPGCPTGQAYDRRRNCVATSDAINSINSFNLG